MKPKKVLHCRYKLVNHTVEQALATARLFIKGATNGFKPNASKEVYHTSPIGYGFIVDFDKSKIGTDYPEDTNETDWEELISSEYDRDWGPVIFLDKAGHIDLDYLSALQGKICGTAWGPNGDDIKFDDESSLALAVQDLQQGSIK